VNFDPEHETGSFAESLLRCVLEFVLARDHLPNLETVYSF